MISLTNEFLTKYFVIKEPEGDFSIVPDTQNYLVSVSIINYETIKVCFVILE